MVDFFYIISQILCTFYMYSNMFFIKFYMYFLYTIFIYFNIIFLLFIIYFYISILIKDSLFIQNRCLNSELCNKIKFFHFVKIGICHNKTSL